MPTSGLHFDPDNPRFYRLNDASSVDAIIEEMLDDESVQDLMLSIGQKGYFEGEPLLVSRHQDGRLIVVEGNRRLAAVKLLNGEISPPPRRKAGLAQIHAEVVETPPRTLPCLYYENRRDVLRYLGYRHITGIKEWDSLSKAKYLFELKEEFYKNQDQATQLKSLAKDIGSRADYVGQLLTALSLYTKAEDSKFFDLPIAQKDVEFSYITTAIGYTKIASWLGLQSKSDIEAKDVDDKNLKRAFAWMFSKDQQGRTILGESRNLDQMAAVVTSEAAVENLERTGHLAEAYLYTDGPQAALESALTAATERIRTVWSMLPNTAQLTAAHLAQAEHLADESRSIRNYIRDKVED